LLKIAFCAVLNVAKILYKFLINFLFVGQNCCFDSFMRQRMPIKTDDEFHLWSMVLIEEAKLPNHFCFTKAMHASPTCYFTKAESEHSDLLGMLCSILTWLPVSCSCSKLPAVVSRWAPISTTPPGACSPPFSCTSAVGGAGAAAAAAGGN
jgi:hypothetical protein